MDFRDIHLRVLYSFNYETKGGRKISITEGEKLFLIRKTNADWWQVIRNSSEKPFFVPASYVEEIRYEDCKIENSNSHVPVNKKKTDCPITDSDNTLPCDENKKREATGPASSAAYSYKASARKMGWQQQPGYNNLTPMNKRISSEKWRLWAAQELISELAGTTSLHSVDDTVHKQQKMTSEQSYLKTQTDNHTDSLSHADKESSLNQEAQFVSTACCLSEPVFPNKKEDIRNCFGSSYSEGSQAEFIQAASNKSHLNHHLFNLYGSSSDSLSVESELAVECYPPKNTATGNKDFSAVGERQESSLLSSSSHPCFSGSKLCGSSSDLENHLYNLGDSVQDIQAIDVCSVRSDMFSKMKSKLKYSTSFKTKRELQKLSEKREGSSVLSSSWDKLDNFKVAEATGPSIKDNVTGACSDISLCSENQSSCPDGENSSCVTGSHDNSAASHHFHDLDRCLPKENISKSGSKCDCNANYTVVKGKSCVEEHSVCKDIQECNLMSDCQNKCRDRSDSEHSKDLSDLPDGTSNSEKITSSCESIEDWRTEEETFQQECAADVVSIPLPEGWVESYDHQLDLPCYIHEKSGEKWFSSNDAEGRVYFYQENSSESSWRLPEVPTTMLEEISSRTVSPSEMPSRTVSPNEMLSGIVGQNETKKEKEKPTVIISSDDSQIRHQVDAESRPTFRMAKARSMVLTDTKSKEASAKSSSVPRNYLPIWDGRVHTLKEGLLNKTKMWEIGGKKIRKNWAPSYVVLSKFHLLFFKDNKTYNALKFAVSPGSNSVLPDLCIDLKGALVEEAEKLSSRRYVFAVTTVQGLKVLLQCDDKLLYTEWYHAVRNAIRSITEGSGLRNSASTKDVGSFLNQAVSPNQSRKVPRIDRARSVKNKNREGSLEDLASSPEDQQIGIHTRLKNFFLRRPLKEALEQRGILKNEAVFGCHLPDVCLEEPYVPLFVRKCVEVIESKDENMKTVGLYRASGNLSQVQKIRLQVNQDNYKVLEEEEDVHVLTGALKLFFRELKEPVIPCRLFSRALDASSKSIEEEKLRDFQGIVKSLPKPNRCTLKFLLKHLLRVTDYKADNQMSIHTLAIVFGPSLMWPEEESQNIAFDFMMQNVVIEFLLKAFHSIFDDSCDVSA